ncbi:hypothetical protein N015_09605 [Pseudomonas asturiensis]|uniref:WD40-like Beta Propeller Repeat n=1 Tax=Pseudomonas asturiensis TaxID=1190415 RepID=A0ABX6HAQ1_9PSED|nr:WD40 repeat domain-containing protein [Pseudomonas asturiensis]QHF02650.1 hypothetical protein N015_09605 [Pseudomonas asturiensis]
MKWAGLWKYAFWVAAISHSSFSNAVTLPPGWDIRPSTVEDIDKGLPSALQSSELANNGRRLAGVKMVVALPFSQVLPVVISALEPLGPLRGETGMDMVSNMDNAWGAVLLTRRPDLVHDLVRQFDMPRLQQYVRDGALAESEIAERIERIERTLRFQSGSPRMALLTEQYAYWNGSAKREHGTMGRSTSIVIAHVIQLDAVFGRPVTAVYLTRNDDYPNPDSGLISQVRRLADLNIFNPGQPKRLQRSSVPGELFSPVFEALSTLPNANLELGADAERWRAPPRPTPSVSEPKLTLPNTQARVLEARAVLPFKNPDDFTVLADGSVLLIRSYPRALMHWSPDAGEPREVWKPSQFFTKWLLSRDASGQSAYMTEGPLVMRFDAKTQSLNAHPMVFDKPGLQYNAYMDYFPDGNGVPLIYRHQYLTDHNTFEVWQAVAQPAGDGTQWNYTLRFASPRQEMMNYFTRGNGQIKPVRWDGTLPTVWVEDAYGLSELDGKTGRVLRVVKLPRRFGEVDPADDTGMAQWTPEPFGSVKGRWIAVGFVLMEGKRRNPGVHVVDVASGKVRYSLTLPDQDSLETAVGSPDGRLLALATGSRKNVAVLWNLENGRSLTLQSGDAGCRDLEQLQWSPDGLRLWGRCQNGLMTWDMSATW